LPFRSSKAGTLVLLGALGAPRWAGAADVTEPIRIEYRAELGCPSADDFNAQVFRRTTSARLATGGDTARTFIVNIERRGSALVGSLVVRQADGTTESREVAGPGCREVATVLALATALAIDPRASLAPDADLPPAPAPEPSPPVSPSESTASDAAPDETSSSEADLSDEDRRRWIVALGPSVEGGVTPLPAYGGSVAFGWRSPSGKGALSAFGVELTWLMPKTHRVGTAHSSFQLLYARPELCSVALRWHEESGIAPCLGAELGAVTGWGSDIAQADHHTRIWSTIDMGLRLHQALGAAWFVEADAGVVLPITRYHYVFHDPETRIFTVPSAAVTGGLRVGARLW
jgi:hypothetical protein